MAGSERRGSDRWTGRSGRRYARVPGGSRREGRKSDVIQVEARGAPQGASTVERGAVLGMKRLRSLEPEHKAAFDRELRVMVGLSKALAAPPCPRVVDGVDEASAPAVILEWCGTDLELWWAAHHAEPGSVALLLEALAQVAELVADFHESAGREPAFTGMHPRLRPQGILRAEDGRWVAASFGRSESPGNRPERADGSTQLMAAAENFAAPETIFAAKEEIPEAVDTWSVACMLFALLRMRTLLLQGAQLPTSGTDSHHFRSHRVNLVNDLYQRKSRLFVKRRLDARQFLYPERLPDADRRALEESLMGALPVDRGADEGRLKRAVIAVVEKALHIDPARRYTRPRELAQDLREAVAIAQGAAPLEDTDVHGTPPPAAAEEARTAPPSPPPSRPPRAARQAALSPDPSVPQDTQQALAASTRIMDSSTATDALLAAAAQEQAERGGPGSGPAAAAVEEGASAGVLAGAPVGDSAGDDLDEEPPEDLPEDPGTDESASRDADSGSRSVIISKTGSPPERPAPPVDAGELRSLRRQLKTLEGDLASLRRKLRQVERDVRERPPPTPAPPPARSGGWGAALMAFGSLGLAALAAILATWALVLIWSEPTGASATGPVEARAPGTAAAGAPAPPTPRDPAEGSDPDGLADAEGAPPPAEGTPPEAGAGPGSPGEGATRPQPGAETRGSAGARQGPRPPKQAKVEASDETASEDPSGRGTVRITGGEAVLVASDGSERSPGLVPAGTWKIFLVEGAERRLVDTVEVSEGATVEYRCGFGTCRRTR